MNYLTKCINTIRVPDVSAVKKLHDELKNDPMFELVRFEYTHKDIKAKGEIVDSYELVKATLLFNDEKEPDKEIIINYEC